MVKDNSKQIDLEGKEVLTLKDLGLEVVDNPDFKLPNISTLLNTMIDIETIRFNTETKFPYFIVNEKYKGSNEVLMKQLIDIDAIKGRLTAVRVKLTKPKNTRYLMFI